MPRNEIDALFSVNPRQARFVDEYLVDLNATQAAIRAGYSKRSANQQASDLLALPKIQTLLAERRREMAAEGRLSVAQVLAQLARQSFFDPRRLIDPVTREPIHLADLPDDIALCIQGIEIERAMDQQMVDGELVQTPRVTYKLKFVDKGKSVDMLMRHLGLYEKDNAQANPVTALFEYIESRKAGALQVKSLEAEVLPQAQGQVAQLEGPDDDPQTVVMP